MQSTRRILVRTYPVAQINPLKPASRSVVRMKTTELLRDSRREASTGLSTEYNPGSYERADPYFMHRAEAAQPTATSRSTV